VAVVAMLWETVKAGACAGSCQPNSDYCPSAYKSGYCPGSSSIECCPESVSSCGNASSQCQLNTIPCNGKYKAGLCPGDSTIECCESSMQFGVDVSTLGSASTWSCVKNQGYHRAIPRCYQSNGVVDPNCKSNINNAHSAGMQTVDVYMFPCYPCGNPVGQMDTLINALSGLSYGKIWLDIETYQWSSSLSSNQAFITSLINEGKAKGKSLGIYSNYYNWESIVGLGWCYPEQQGLPIWYANYDNTPSFAGFTSFGCWSSPYMKQYRGTSTVCSYGVDLNCY